jgi:hypothetical protein
LYGRPDDLERCERTGLRASSAGHSRALRLASFVAIGKDDDVAKIFRQIERAQARRR